MRSIFHSPVPSKEADYYGQLDLQLTEKLKPNATNSLEMLKILWYADTHYFVWIYFHGKFEEFYGTMKHQRAPPLVSPKCPSIHLMICFTRLAGASNLPNALRTNPQCSTSLPTMITEQLLFVLRPILFVLMSPWVIGIDSQAIESTMAFHNSSQFITIDCKPENGSKIQSAAPCCGHKMSLQVVRTGSSYIWHW